MVIDIEISKQLLRTNQERGDGICVQKTGYDQVPVNVSSSHRIRRVTKITGCSPISMKLSPIMKQGFNHIEPRPHALSHLIDLLLCEILEVGVGGHDGHQRPDRKFIKTAPQHTTRITVIGLAREPPQ